MAPGSLTTALLILALGAPPQDVVPMNSHSFKIPITVKQSERDKIKELILFVSENEGRTWQETATTTPDKDAFVFFAQHDGVFWFNICIVSQQGTREPPDINKVPPAQKVMVDTLKPTLNITQAERQGDDIAVAWEMQEQHPDLNTLTLEYRTSGDPSWMWYKAPVTPAPSGRTHFRFINSGPVTIRMQVMDLAGNVGTAQADVPAKAGNTAAVAQSTSAKPQGPSETIPPTPPAAAPLPPAPTLAEMAGSRAPVTPPPSLVTGPAMDSALPVQTTTPPAPRTPATPEQSLLAGLAAGMQQVSAPAANNTNHPAPGWGAHGAGTPATGAPAWPANQQRELQITNSPHLVLDYDVTNVGPSGLGSVELYITQDEGQTWQRFAEDADLKPPMTVDLPGEGVFGLYLVVRSRAGLGRKPPQPGDLPQMRVEVDTTPPSVKLGYPKPDPTDKNKLILSWEARDRNLGQNPVTLEWAERPDGQWKTIAANLSTGTQYAWSLTQDLPYRVYLRATVKDKAGNVTRETTPEPILVDLHEPEGTIRGLVKQAP
jgi:hypothetical protein